MRSLTRRQCCVDLSTLMLGQLFIASSTAQSLSIYPRFARGINFHHLLNWPNVQKLDNGKVNYVWPPFADEKFKVSDSELAKLKRVGFDSIRLTADPSIFAEADGDRRRVLDRLVQDTISRLLGAGFKVVFDLHPVAVNPDYAPAKLIADSSAPVFMSYARLVEHMAGVLKDMPYDKVVFELMNEPWIARDSDFPRWQAMQQELHSRARAAAPNLPLLLTGALWSNIRALISLDVHPFKDSNVLYTFHYYDPHTFTHQSVRGDDAEYIVDLTWPPQNDNINKVLQDALTRIANDQKLDENTKRQKQSRTRKLLSDYRIANHTADQIKADFASVEQWAVRNSVSRDRIVLGEFGCVATSNDLKVLQARSAWLRAVRTTAEEFGFPWAFWAYKGWGGMSLMDTRGTQLDEGVLETLGLTA
jgi:endoglucanase